MTKTKSSKSTLTEESNLALFILESDLNEQDRRNLRIRSSMEKGIPKIFGNLRIPLASESYKESTPTIIKVKRVLSTLSIPELAEIRIIEDVSNSTENLNNQIIKDLQSVRFKPIFQKLDGFLDLPENWDSYGSLKIYPECIEAAKRLIKEIMVEPSFELPFPVPLYSGYLQLEWHRFNMDLEIEFISLNEIEIYYYDTEDELEWIENIDSLDITKLSKLIRKFS